MSSHINGQINEDEKWTLMVWIPGRPAPRFVPGISPTISFVEVRRRIGTAWGLTNVDECILGHYCTTLKCNATIANQEQWAYAVQENFFRTKDQQDAHIRLDLVQQGAPTAVE